MAEPTEAPRDVLGAGAGGPLSPPGAWIQEKDTTSAYVTYPAGVLIGNPSGGNKGIGALNLQSIYINGAQFLPANYLLLVGGTLTGPLTLSADPTAQYQAATKNYVDNRITTVNGTFASYLPLAGGTMSGTLTMGTGANLILAADPTVNLQAATKHYVDQQFAGLIGIPDAPADGTFYGRNNNAWSNIIDMGTY